MGVYFCSIFILFLHKVIYDYCVRGKLEHTNHSVERLNLCKVELCVWEVCILKKVHNGFCFAYPKRAHELLVNRIRTILRYSKLTRFLQPYNIHITWQPIAVFVLHLFHLLWWSPFPLIFVLFLVAFCFFFNLLLY